MKDYSATPAAPGGAFKGESAEKYLGLAQELLQPRHIREAQADNEWQSVARVTILGGRDERVERMVPALLPVGKDPFRVGFRRRDVRRRY